ncbi:MAG: ABC transporter ATP-binding protein [Bacillota bacterium]
MPLLDIQKLTAGYNDVVIVDQVDARVNAGDLVVVVGPNGSGKSTLVKGLLGLARQFSGKTYFDQQDITRLEPWQAVKVGIGYVPQTNNVFTNLMVSENLEMGAFCRMDKKAIKSDMDEIYEQFPELARRKKARAETLSGGERQLLAIARSMMSRPRMLFLDEPLAFLSPKASALVMNRLLEIQAAGTSMLMIEQNTKIALQNATYAYVLNEGRCVMEGKGPELWEDKSLRQRFLGLDKEEVVTDRN